MLTVTRLHQETTLFFDRHWHLSNPERPKWLGDWQFNGSVPNYDKGGVYALIDDQGEVMYIGLGASLGGGIYKNCGLSKRLMAHVIRSSTREGYDYEPRDNWQDVSTIATLGFEAESAYLAPALEDFLIKRLRPSRNKVKRG